MEWVKTLGNIRTKLIYFACEQDMNLGGSQKSGCYTFSCVPLKFIS